MSAAKSGSLLVPLVQRPRTEHHCIYAKRARLLPSTPPGVRRQSRVRSLPALVRNVLVLQVLAYHLREGCQSARAGQAIALALGPFHGRRAAHEHDEMDRTGGSKILAKLQSFLACCVFEHQVATLVPFRKSLKGTVKRTNKTISQSPAPNRARNRRLPLSALTLLSSGTAAETVSIPL